MKLLKAAVIATAAAAAGCSQAVDPTVTGGISTLGYASHDVKKLKANGGGDPFTAQTPRVSTDCFPKELEAVLRKLHRRFGKKPIVTSGHRPRSGRSQHSSCRAADIRIPGVKPSTIAGYARTIDGIGGVGTYRRTSIVHVDVGPRRDWRH